jgi:hypothetical protein
VFIRQSVIISNGLMVDIIADAWIGGDDGATYPRHWQREATSGMYLTLRTFDLAKWQPEATAFPSMLAQC